MMAAIFRKKMRSHDEVADSGLHRYLGALDLTILGIGAIIGTGIFVLTGIAAATQAGPAVILSFVVAGLACGFAAMAYAELASIVGGCGSAYGYSYAAFGELFAWCIGWILLLEYSVAVAAVANGWSGYFDNAMTAMGLNLPSALTRAPSLGGIVNLPALLIVLVLMLLLSVGIKESARFNLIMVFVKLLTIAVFIGIAAFNVDPENWSPFMPFGWFSEGPTGKPVGVLAGAAIIFFAYIGFDAVSTAAEEARNPQRDLPIGIMASLLICTALYIVVAGLLTGIVSYTELNVPSPVAHALQLIGFNGASGLVAAGAIAGITTVMLVLYYGLTRILFAMSRDGLLPTFFAVIHPRTRTPVRAIVFTGVLMALTAGFVPLGQLAELVNIGTLSAFVMVCLGVLALRVLHPDVPRSFRAPFGPVLPVLGVVSCGLLMAALPGITWLRFGIWLTIGLVIYFFYSMKRSKLATQS
ncbi:MAG: amino acid permease [Pseudomonadales bacterium]|nr:amino acid permease [Pseudomonadales bacterium]